jgi:pimeloyl-ACP methyl ester carboxylesterase
VPPVSPFPSHYLYPDGLRYHYVDEGRGDPVLMLHGNPTWSYFWRGLIRGLRDRWRCVAPDHMGCGLSDKPGDSRYVYSLANRVRDLERFVEALKLGDRLTLVLHDWGGMIGMAWAVKYPQRVKRLVVMNTAAFLLPAGKKLPWSLRLCRWPIVGPLLVRGLNSFCRGAADLCVAKDELPDDVRAAYLAPYDSWKNRIAVLRFVQDIPLKPGHRSYEQVRQVQDSLEKLAGVPMLICWGERDFVFDRHFLEEWLRRFPQAEVHRFPEAGHYVMEDAGDQIVPLVRAFLEKHPV